MNAPLEPNADRLEAPVAAGVSALLVWTFVAVSRNGLGLQIGLATACAAVVAFARFRRPVRRFASVVAAVVLAACLLNLVFQAYLATSAGAYDLDAFRPALRTRQWPLYGRRWRNAWPGAFAAMASAALLGSFAFVAATRATPRRVALPLAVLCGLTLLACFGYALSDPTGRAGAIFVADRRFVEDATPFKTNEWSLADYIGWMRGLSSFGRHYPPGNMLLLGYGGLIGRNMQVLAVAATPALLWLAGRAWGLSRRASWLAALLVGCCGYVLSLSTISVTSETLPLAAAGLWLAGRALGVGGRPAGWAAVALGGLCYGWGFFTFSVTTWAASVAVAAALLVAWRRVRPTRLLFVLNAAGACFAAVGLGVWEATGFDWLACLREGMLRHHEQIGGPLLPPGEPPGRYLLRGAGNALAPLVAWLPLSAVAAIGGRSKPTRAPCSSARGSRSPPRPSAGALSWRRSESCCSCCRRWHWRAARVWPACGATAARRPGGFLRR